MADTNIEWADRVWNPIAGCSIVSPGCTNCYAMKMAHRIEGMNAALGRRNHYAGLTTKSKAGAVWTGKVAVAADNIFLAPLSWKKPARVFANSMADLFHEDVPDDVIDRAFAVMALCPHLTFMVLTKRAARMRQYWGGPSGNTSPTGFRCPRLNHVLNVADHMSRRDHPAAFSALAANVQQIAKAGHFPNVWLGVSTEDQARADERIPDLLATPAAVRFLSCEPLLGPVDLLKWFDPTGACCGGEPEFRCDNCPADAEWRFSGQCTAESLNEPRLDWVIVGSESGPRSRPCDINWVRAIKDQCVSAGTAFFWKQHAANGRKITTPELDGRRWMEMPGARDNG